MSKVMTAQEQMQLFSEYQAFIGSLAVGQQGLENVIKSGTTLVNDPNYAATFGAIPGYTDYLLACKALIDTLFANWPTPPVVQWPVGS